MKIKETIKELSYMLEKGEFTRDCWELKDILSLLEDRPDKATSKLIRLFSNYNDYFERAFTRVPYPERDHIQIRFRKLKEQLLNELAENI